MVIAEPQIIVCDPNPANLKSVSRALSPSAAVHACADRVDAVSRLWNMAKAGVVPRAVVANWLLSDDRLFYSLLGRESDQTSLPIFKNAKIIDDRDGKASTIMLCYTDTHLEEAVFQLEAAGLINHVAVVDFSHGPGYIAGLLRMDERTRIIQTAQIDYPRCVRDGKLACTRCGACGSMSAIELTAQDALEPRVSRRISSYIESSSTTTSATESGSGGHRVQGKASSSTFCRCQRPR